MDLLTGEIAQLPNPAGKNIQGGSGEPRTDLCRHAVIGLMPKAQIQPPPKLRGIKTRAGVWAWDLGHSSHKFLILYIDWNVNHLKIHPFRLAGRMA